MKTWHAIAILLRRAVGPHDWRIAKVDGAYQVQQLWSGWRPGPSFFNPG